VIVQAIGPPHWALRYEDGRDNPEEELAMATLRTPLCEILGLEHPIIQAPMAGATTVDLVAAVCGAGALGGFGHAYSEPETMRDDAAGLRARTRRPFAINLFAAPTPGEPDLAAQREAIAAVRGDFEARGLPLPERVAPPYAPERARQIEAVCDIRPAAVTVHLGDMSPDTLARFHGLGVRVGGSATSVREARHLEALGVDFIVAQGAEAGGHRGTFLHVPEHVMTGTLALVRQVVQAVRTPVIAAGGIMDGAAIAAVLALGAQAAQIGTAFLLCPESGASEVHRKAIAGMDGDETTLTRAFTGKPARAVRNRFIDEAERTGLPFLPFPAQQKLTAPLRAASAREGSPDHIAGWSGQAGALARRLPAADLVRLLIEEACDTVERLRRLTSA
jgi:nitronate monooxygenase